MCCAVHSACESIRHSAITGASSQSRKSGPAGSSAVGFGIGAYLAFRVSPMSPVSKKLTRRTRLWVLLAALGVLAAVVITALLSIPLRSDTLKARVVALLAAELESEVTIA